MNKLPAELTEQIARSHQWVGRFSVVVMLLCVLKICALCRQPQSGFEVVVERLVVIGMAGVALALWRYRARLARAVSSEQSAELVAACHQHTRVWQAWLLVLLLLMGLSVLRYFAWE